ncbi:hypothetical protein [Parachlamydia acanthamoebae]|uniref:hypothetical protein n=1 Tax=Parachlamydia acanthamoebae TaxID=83552 RepID=UPI0001C174EA|nr:hypothetical protein [Parachlamydia acanthamoebae]EFB41129.1 hypothetical protein pah_c050o099 [Parachlamydia acanthamoebae str. Hall's coccus]
MDTHNIHSNGSEWLYPSIQKKEGEPSHLIENENSLKDFEFQKVISIDAGYSLIERMHDLFSKQVQHLPPERQNDVHHIFKTKKEQFQSLLANQAEKYNTASEANLSTRNFYKNWKQKKSIRKRYG